MDKRPCFSEHSPRVSKRDYNRFNVDTLLESLFAISDSTLIDASFDGLVESRSTESDQNDLIQRAFHIGSVLLEASKRSVRKLSSVHNASVWPLPPDLTIKVFTMLDTPSVCSAAATCLFFQKCAIDPLCYANIELAIPKVNDAVASTMIQRAGNVLESIKLGVLPPYSIEYSEDESCILTSFCLNTLSANDGASGSRLKRLHLYNIDKMDDIALLDLLYVCPSLVDLEIVYSHVNLNNTLKSVSINCRLLERFVFEPTEEGADYYLEDSTCKEFVLNCPKITTLALKGCVVGDNNALILVKGFQELKYVDFSQSGTFRGTFLKNLGRKGGGNNLEVMILRDAYDLKKAAVNRFMRDLRAGKFRLLRHLDISNTEGLAINMDNRCYNLSSILLQQLLEQRPNLCFVAEFPVRDDDSPRSYHSSSSDYDSDLGSGSEESSSVAYEESSDEIDDLPI